MRDDFARASDEEILRTSSTLVENGIETMSELKSTPKRNRGYLIEGLRRIGADYVRRRFLHQLFDACPRAPKNVSGLARIDIEEVCIPKELRSYKIDFPKISADWRPEQAAVNLVTSEMALSASAIHA